MGLRVTVIGAGYVGLTSAVAFALAGHAVRLVERDPLKLATLRSGHAPFNEPGLEEALGRCAAHLEFTADALDATATAEVVVVAVGTPPGLHGAADLTQVWQAVDAIAPVLERPGFRVLAVKSTVPVGTGDAIEAHLRTRAPRATAEVVSAPEFLRQGRALADTVAPDRIVIGAASGRAFKTMRALYAPFVQGEVRLPGMPTAPGPVPVLELSRRSAELSKYAANAFLAMKISFANEIANLCDGVDANVDEVLGVLGLDERIGGAFLGPGLGYGGSCFPKDTRALESISLGGGYDFRLLRAVIEVNAAQWSRLLDRLEAHLGGWTGKGVAVLGLSFKPLTDDVRESIGVMIALELQRRGVAVRVHDPLVRRVPALRAAGLEVSPGLRDAVHGADAAILATAWPEYLGADWALLGGTMRTRVMADGRNALEPDALVRLGFSYLGVGRGLRVAQLEPANAGG